MKRGFSQQTTFELELQLFFGSLAAHLPWKQTDRHTHSLSLSRTCTTAHGEVDLKLTKAGTVSPLCDPWKRLRGMQEIWVRSLGREDPLEKEMATHSSTLAWRIPWREEPGGLQSMGSQRVGHN